VASRDGEPKPFLIIMHGESSCPGRIGQLLRKRGHRLDVRKPRFGCALPHTLEHHAGAVIFGGPMSANDPDEYIRKETDFIGVALKEDKPFLGVCLGAQMLAKHLGAKVEAHPDRLVEVGYYAVKPTPEGARFGRWPDRFYQWHREGFELPAGAVRLATGDIFENQAYAFGKAAAGVQFHPEITYALVRRWTVVADYMTDYPNAQAPAEHVAGHLDHAAAVTDWLDRFLEQLIAKSLVGA
jgi:GMP synthase (glutamine-hydrolysing)